MRLHITGNAGAGKTTLAKALAFDMNLPLFHLDQVVWLPGWNKPDPESRRVDEIKLTQGKDWIIEGVSDIVRARADLTLFIDVPRHKCVMRCFKRNLPYLFTSRPELPAKCPEILIVGRLISIIWNFPSRAGAKIAAEASKNPNVIRIHEASRAKAMVETGYSTRRLTLSWSGQIDRALPSLPLRSVPVNCRSAL